MPQESVLVQHLKVLLLFGGVPELDIGTREARLVDASLGLVYPRVVEDL